MSTCQELTISEDDQKSIKTFYDKFKAHVQPKLNPIFAIYQLYHQMQDNNSIDAFVTRLRTKARDCNFTDADDMIRDRIVFGCSSPKVREKLINVGEKLTLDRAIQIAQNHEYCQKQLTSMGATPDDNSVDYVKRGQRTDRRQSHQHKSTMHFRDIKQQTQKQSHVVVVEGNIITMQNVLQKELRATNVEK
jgi:hypothetical protein